MYGKETWVNAKAMRSRGMSYSEIAKALGINKRTAIKLCKQEEVPAPKPRERISILDPYTEIIDAWLEKRPKMKATQIFAQLGPLGYAGSYPTVKRYVAAKKEALARQATVRFETLPGYQAQVDFGKVRVEFLSGEIRRITFFLLQLGFSRYRVAYVCPDETRDTLIACLSQAFLELGGLPQELLLDNMKPVVVRPRTADEPAVLAEDWMRFCATCGIVTNPCWPFRAQTKGKVERLMGVVKQFLSSRTFLDLEHLEGEFRAETMRQGASIHSTTKQEPLLRLELERNYLGELPPHPYSYTVSHERVVSRDLLVSFEGNRYSVPQAFAQKRVKVKATPREVLVFSCEGALIANHRRRGKGAGEVVMDPEHYRGLAGAELAFSHLERLKGAGTLPLHRGAEAPNRLRGGGSWR